jgi:hypothetical protein
MTMSHIDLTEARFVPKSATKRSIIIALALGAVSSLGVAAQKAYQIDPQTILQNLATALGVAFALALLLERATEALLRLICGPEEIALKSEDRATETAAAASLAREKSMMEALKTTEERLAFLSQGGSSLRIDALDRAHTETIRDRSQRSARLKITKQFLSTVILTVLGGALSASGFRILSQVFSSDQIEASTLASMLDIVVTTLVLGGGSQGLHDLIDALTASRREV